MELKKKQGIYLMLASAVVLVGVLVFVFGMPGTAPGDTPTATSTEPVATPTNIFDMEPIVPEAKVSTEGWKTCRNEEYGYEFKFPGEWNIYGADALSEPNPHPISKRVYVRESEECNGASVFLSAFEPWSGALGTSDDGDFHINVRFNKTSNHDYLRTFLSTQDGKKSVMEHVWVDGQTSILQADTNTSLYNGRSWRLRTVSSNKEYRVLGSFYAEQRNTIETILSTFRFLDTSTTTAPSGTSE